MKGSLIRHLMGDAKSAAKNPRQRAERAWADFRAGLVAAAAVVAFETLTAGVAMVVIVAIYFVTPWGD